MAIKDDQPTVQQLLSDSCLTGTRSPRPLAVVTASGLVEPLLCSVQKQKHRVTVGLRGADPTSTPRFVYSSCGRHVYGLTLHSGEQCPNPASHCLQGEAMAEPSADRVIIPETLGWPEREAG